MKPEERQARLGTPVQAPSRMDPVHRAIPMSTRTSGDGGTQVQRGNEDKRKPRREVEHKGQARPGKSCHLCEERRYPERGRQQFVGRGQLPIEPGRPVRPRPGHYLSAGRWWWHEERGIGRLQFWTAGGERRRITRPPGKGLLAPRHGRSFPETGGT